MTYSTSNDCRIIVPSPASCCAVILTFTLLECGSVHMKLASIMRTRFKPLSLRKHNASNSRDSGWATSHCEGGESHLSQSPHTCSTDSRWIPEERSTLSLRHSEQSAPADKVPSIGTPQL